MDTSLALQVIQLMNEMITNNDDPVSSNDLSPIAKKLGAKLAWGATRWAFVFERQGIVVKFPRYEETETDYCEIEYDHYLAAKNYGVERCLLPIQPAGTTESGIPVYVQPMYSFAQSAIPPVIARQWESKMKNLRKAPVMQKIERGCYEAPTGFWLKRATQIYGKAFMRSFEKWTHECAINDLHSSNVGYLGKQPIIIDYAGYYD